MTVRRKFVIYNFERLPEGFICAKLGVLRSIFLDSIGKTSLWSVATTSHPSNAMPKKSSSNQDCKLQQECTAVKAQGFATTRTGFRLNFTLKKPNKNKKKLTKAGQPTTSSKFDDTLSFKFRRAKFSFTAIPLLK